MCYWASPYKNSLFSLKRHSLLIQLSSIKSLLFHLSQFIQFQMPQNVPVRCPHAAAVCGLTQKDNCQSCLKPFLLDSFKSLWYYSHSVPKTVADVTLGGVPLCCMFVFGHIVVSLNCKAQFMTATWWLPLKMLPQDQMTSLDFEALCNIDVHIHK